MSLTQMRDRADEFERLASSPAPIHSWHQMIIRVGAAAALPSVGGPGSLAKSMLTEHKANRVYNPGAQSQP